MEARTFARTVEKSLAVITRSLLFIRYHSLVKRFVFRAAFGVALALYTKINGSATRAPLVALD